MIPLFVRAGSIIPISEPISHTDEKKGEVSEILVYSGDDGEITLYNDSGDGYAYENGSFSEIPLNYNDQEKTFTFGKAAGQFRYQESFRIQLIGSGQPRTIEVSYQGEEHTIIL